MHKVVFKSGFCFDYINLLQLSNCYSSKSIVTNAFENQYLKIMIKLWKNYILVVN